MESLPWAGPLISLRSFKKVREKSQSQRERLENVTLLVLGVEDGASSQQMQVVSRN